jgi:membrane protein YqaA with SNARE-associated domain
MDMQLLAGVFVGVLIAGFLPWPGAEAILIGASLLVAPQSLVPLVAVSTAAQMLAKTSLYAAARWAPKYLPQKALELIDQAEKYKEKRKTMAMILLASSSLSVPPFFVIAIASGTLRVPFGMFIGAGAGGIVSRYAFFAWSAMLVNDIPGIGLGT